MYTYDQLLKLKRQNSENRLSFLHMHSSQNALYHFYYTCKTQDCFQVHKNIEELGVSGIHYNFVSQCDIGQPSLPLFLVYPP